MNQTCRLIVLESHGTWAAALRRLGNLDGSAREVRSVTDAEAELSDAPASFVVAELLAPNAAALIDRIECWGRRYPQARFAIVVARELASWLDLAREAGAVHVTTSPRKLQPLLAAIARHQAERPQPPGSAAERIWSELPLSPASSSPNTLSSA